MRKRSALSSVFFCALTHSSACLALDPYSTGFAAAGAVAGAIDTASRKDWESRTTGQLDRLLSVQSFIVDDLKQLRVDIDRIVTEGFTRYASAQLSADIQEFDLNTNDMLQFQSLAAGRKALIWANEAKMEQDTFVVESYGPASYQSTFAGILGVEAIYKFAGESAKRRIVFLKRQESIFDNWLTPQPGFPAFVKDQEDKEIVLAISRIKGRQSYINSGYIVGSIETGFKIGRIDCSRSTAGQCINRQLYTALVVRDLNAYSQDYNQHKPLSDRLSVILDQIKSYRDHIVHWEKVLTYQ